MNRQDLIDAIAEDTEASKAATTRFLDSLITIVQSEVAKGGAVKLTGFGTFEKAAVAARTGRNPKTGEEIPITARRVVTFHASQKLKAMVEAANHAGTQPS